MCIVAKEIFRWCIGVDVTDIFALTLDTIWVFKFILLYCFFLWGKVKIPLFWISAGKSKFAVCP